MAYDGHSGEVINLRYHRAECHDIPETLSKFETELTECAPHNRENGLKITRGVHVFLVFTKIALNKPLLLHGLPYGM